MKRKRFNSRKNITPGIGVCGTYEIEEGWLTPMGDFNLVHLDCPSSEKIRDRVKEVMSEEQFDDDCPLCQMMKEEKGYNIVYQCRIWCHDCKKAELCKNFNPKSVEYEKKFLEDLDEKEIETYYKMKKKSPDSYLF